MKQNSYTRYHRFDDNGTKYIKRFEHNSPPPVTADIGYTCWVRGTGPHSDTALRNVAEGVRRACLGVPKTPEQREKMRQAKLGVPKSQEHKDNMRKSWYKRKEKQLQQHYE